MTKSVITHTVSIRRMNVVLNIVHFNIQWHLYLSQNCYSLCNCYTLNLLPNFFLTIHINCLEKENALKEGAARLKLFYKFRFHIKNQTSYKTQHCIGKNM